MGVIHQVCDRRDLRSLERTQGFHGKLQRFYWNLVECVLGHSQWGLLLPKLIVPGQIPLFWETLDQHSDCAVPNQPSMTIESNVLDSANALEQSPLTDCPTSNLAPQAEESGADGADDAFAKRPTVSIDLEKESFSVASSSKSLHYIQGVLQGDQVYIVTNLMDHQSQTLRQPQTAWTIGRNRAAALPLQDRNLSRRHAVLLYVADDGFYLVDLNSMNGSYVNDQRVQQRQRLHDGDRIRIGGTEFSFFLSAEARILEPIHPEVLARLTNAEARQAFIDFSELNEEISFNVLKR